ncbi:MAG: GEVED domain-containing protein [Weeksellaceae bacterium]|jgi:hypothetical protein|nr:GEVED domain-containing protein [Weeksellaceae bacterium]
MSNNYLVKIKSLLLSFGLLLGGLAFAQVEYKELPDFGSAIMGINSNGHGVHSFGYYDFETNTSSFPEDGVGGTSAINDNEEVLGLYDADNIGEYEAAIRTGGVWVTFPSTVPLTMDDTFYAISDNGVWVAGQTGWDPDTDSVWGFLYNTQTQEFTLLESALYEYGAAYGVNNDGVAVGWVDDLDYGTLRMPAIFMPDGEIILIQETAGEASGINNLGQVVGSIEGSPFIYDIANDELQIIDFPVDLFGATFADISDTGIAIGYGELPGFSRAPILYHPLLGQQARLLSEVLSQFGIDGSSLNGTAYRISSDGNYVGGFTDGPAFFAMGWAVYFDDMLLIESECTLECPSNIIIDVEMGETTAVVEYELSYSCQDEEPDGLEIVLINGLPSGSAFPLGSTIVYHELRNADGEAISACSFTVKVNDYYCTPGFDMVEPITRVIFEEIDNETANTSSAPKTEYFLDMTANVQQGESYPIAVEAYTGGQYVNYVNVFIDWNQNGEFDEDELYYVGALFNSTGDDGQQVTADIQVPVDAVLGTTRMRVIKSYGESPTIPCVTYSYGQSEEYTIQVNEGSNVPEEDTCTKSTPNLDFNTGLGPVDQYIFANDFVVPAGEAFTVEQVKMVFWIEPGASINSADIYFYQDSGEGPGEEIANQSGVTPSSVKNIGGNFGFIAYECTFDVTPGVLTATGGGDTVYWVGMQVNSNASMVYWGAVTELDTPNEQYIFDPDELMWVTNTSVFEYESDGVMSILGECEELGLNDYAINSDFAYYPNPANEIVNIVSDKTVKSVEIFNLVGQKVLTTTKVQNGQVNMSGLTTGTYVFRVTLDNGQIETFKIVKK